MSDSFATPQTVARKASLSTVFPRQEYRGLPFPPPGVLPDPRIEPVSPALHVNSLPERPICRAENKRCRCRKQMQGYGAVVGRGIERLESTYVHY